MAIYHHVTLEEHRHLQNKAKNKAQLQKTLANLETLTLRLEGVIAEHSA